MMFIASSQPPWLPGGDRSGLWLALLGGGAGGLAAGLLYVTGLVVTGMAPWQPVLV